MVFINRITGPTAMVALAFFVSGCASTYHQPVPAANSDASQMQPFVSDVALRDSSLTEPFRLTVVLGSGSQWGVCSVMNSGGEIGKYEDHLSFRTLYTARTPKDARQQSIAFQYSLLNSPAMGILQALSLPGGDDMWKAARAGASSYVEIAALANVSDKPAETYALAFYHEQQWAGRITEGSIRVIPVSSVSGKNRNSNPRTWKDLDKQVLAGGEALRFITEADQKMEEICAQTDGTFSPPGRTLQGGWSVVFSIDGNSGRLNPSALASAMAAVTVHATHVSDEAYASLPHKQLENFSNRPNRYGM